MPSSHENVSRHYLGEAGELYVTHRQSDAVHVGHRLNFEYFQPYLRETDVVLDFGCGNGGLLRVLKQHVQRVEGLEVNPAAAHVARQSGCVVKGSLEDLPTSAYDRIVSNHVLEHVRDPIATLERLRASLRPGGLLLLKLPINDWRAAGERRWSREDVDHHLHTWTPKLLGNVLYEAGYDVESIRVVTSAWHPRLFPLMRFGLGAPAFWAFAVLKHRRQLFAVARVPA
jgi:2-polyprenyl-3-methyl-5-hydroxy-6-metoxy-1,4-benzoquinol methylase